MIYYLQKAILKSAHAPSNSRAFLKLPSLSSPSSSPGALIRAMPAVFVVIWSTGFIVAKYGMPYAPPLTFLAIRFLLSIVCFLVWIVLARAAWPRSRAQWGHLAVTGVLMHAAYLGGVWIAVKAGMGSGLTASSLAFSLCSRRCGCPGCHQATTRRQARSQGGNGQAWCLAWAACCWWCHANSARATRLPALTLACTIFSLFSITAGTLYQKRFVKPTDVRTANVIQLAAALVVTLPLALFETEAINWTPHFLGAMAWSVLVLTLGGSSLLYLLIQRGAATAVTSLLYLVPPTTALMAWALFGESITTATIVGTVLTALGVSLVVRSAKPPPAA